MNTMRFCLLISLFVVFCTSAQTKNNTKIENPFGEIGANISADRTNIHELPNISDLYRATAVMIPKRKIQDNKLYGFSLRNLLMMKFRTFKFDENLEFLDQPTGAKCSGFLIAPDMLVTAGHCVENIQEANKYVWVFDYTDELSNVPDESYIELDPAQIFEVSEVILSEYNDEEKVDYAFLRLDRKTSRTPFRFRTSGNAKINTKVATIGSPNGLPLKYDDKAKIVDYSSENWFKSNIDTFNGSSGSPVFNLNGFVEGIHVRGATTQMSDGSLASNYWFDEECDCLKKVESKNIGENIKAQAHKITVVPDSILKMAILENIEYSLENNLNDRLKSWASYSWIFDNKYTKDRGRFEWDALAKNDAAALNIILENSSSDLKDKRGRNLLFYAIDKENLDLLRVMLENDIKGSEQDKSGEDAMFYAMKNSSIPVIEELLPYYSPVNRKDKKGDNLLHLSARFQDFSLVKMLVEAGVTPAEENLAKKRPEYYFKENEPILKYLKNARKGKL